MKSTVIFLCTCAHMHTHFTQSHAHLTHSQEYDTSFELPAVIALYSVPSTRDT